MEPKIRDWPEYRPDTGIPLQSWLSPPNKKILAQVLEDAQQVIEIGSWMGASALFMAQTNSNLRIYCVDPWTGSIEHQETYSEIIPKLFDVFVQHTWDFKDRIIPVQGFSQESIPFLAENGAQPDVIYIDGSHEYEDVLNDLEVCAKFFPGAFIVGDDWSWKNSGDGSFSVRNAVVKYAKTNGITIAHFGTAWALCPNMSIVGRVYWTLKPLQDLILKLISTPVRWFEGLGWRYRNNLRFWN